MLTDLESQTSCKFHFSVDPSQWATAMMWAWRDQLLATPARKMQGAYLRAGDHLILEGVLIQLRAPLTSGEAFGRKFTRWEYQCLSTPNQTITTAAFYQTYYYSILLGA